MSLGFLKDKDFLKQGADIVWYEDIKDNFKNVYWNNIKLEKVWSEYAYKR